MFKRFGRLLTVLGAVAALALTAGSAIARQGADDPPSHDARDDNGAQVHRAEARHRHHRHHHRAHHARHGHDDGRTHDAGDDR
jgi:hypothetical protein